MKKMQETVKKQLDEYEYSYSRQVPLKSTKMVEAIGPYGGSVMIHVDSLLTTPSNYTISKSSTIPQNFIDIADNASLGLTGVYVEHPTGVYLNDGQNKTHYSINDNDKNANKSVRILPLITLDELKTDSKATLRNEDTVRSRISGDLLVKTIDTADDFNNAYVDLTNEAKDLFQHHDNILVDLVDGTRSLRDKITADGVSKREADNLRKRLNEKERLLETLHGHMLDVNTDVNKMKEISKRMAFIKEEMKKAHSDTN